MRIVKKKIKGPPSWDYLPAEMDLRDNFQNTQGKERCRRDDINEYSNLFKKARSTLGNEA